MKMRTLVSCFLITVICFCSCTPHHNSMSKLNYDWECDYVKFKVNKNWDFSEGSGYADSAYGLWSWKDNEGYNSIEFDVYYSFLYKKKDKFEAESYYNKNKNPEDMNVESSFVSNNQAYIVISKPKDSNYKIIKFYSDNLIGSFKYAYYDETIVKNIIASMTFKSIK